MAKVKTTEQYKALRARETRKRHKRLRTGKARTSDMNQAADRFVNFILKKPNYADVKPNHTKRAVDIRDMLKARTDTTEESE